MQKLYKKIKNKIKNCIIMFLDRSNTPVKQAVSSYIASSEFAFGGFNSFYAGGLSLIYIQTDIILSLC